MNPEDVKALVDQLMKTGEFLASNAYRIALRQNYAYAAVDSVVMLVLLILGIVLWKHGSKNHAENKYDEDSYMFHYLFAGVFWTISFIELNCTILRLISPEWYAIKDLINLVK